MNLHIINANALQIPLPDKSVQMCVTSPPYYGLRDYGTAKWIGGDVECDHKHFLGGHNPEVSPKQLSSQGTQQYNYRDICPKCGAIRQDSQIGLEQTPDEYVSNIVKVFREVWRVMKDDGVLWLNLGDSYAHSLRQAGEEHAGKLSRNNKGQIKEGYKPLVKGLKEKDLIGIPWRVAFALQADGWYLRQDIIWHKPNPMPESVKDRCTKSHEYIFLLSKQARYYYDADAIMEESSDPQGTIDRYKSNFGGKKNIELLETNQVHTRPIGSRNLHYKNLEPDGQQPNTMHIKRLEGEEYLSPVRNKRSVWTVTTKPYSGAHFATFPQDLIEPCIKAGSRENDTVLDPFNGSGTTGEVCARFGRNYIGIELNREYIELTNERLLPYRMQPSLI